MEDTPINMDKRHFFIGNSGHVSNNHLDVFDKLNHLKAIEDSIIVPLGYGNRKYIELITDRGEKIFNNHFKPILSFIPLKTYNEYIKTTKIAIFNTRRQQGVGTIIPVIWYGAKVFLSKRSTFYHFLKRTGVVVYCYETELTTANLKQGLSLKEIKHNRELLNEYFNQEALLKKLKMQIDNILNDNTLYHV